MELTKIPFSVIAEWMCFLASFWLLRPTVTPLWKWFTPYMAITTALETYNFFVAQTVSHRVDNQWLYNYFFIIYIFFHLYIFANIILLPAIKQLVIVCALTLTGLYIYDWIHIGTAFFSTTITIFGGMVIMLSILYYYSLFKQEEFKSVFSEPAFWFVTGCFIFFTTTTAISAFFEEIVALSEKNNFPIRYSIVNFCNIIMYSCWIKSFLCFKKDQVYSP